MPARGVACVELSSTGPATKHALLMVMRDVALGSHDTFGGGETPRLCIFFKKKFFSS